MARCGTRKAKGYPVLLVGTTYQMVVRYLPRHFTDKRLPVFEG